MCNENISWSCTPHAKYCIVGNLGNAICGKFSIDHHARAPMAVKYQIAKISPIIPNLILAEVTRYTVQTGTWLSLQAEYQWYTVCTLTEGVSSLVGHQNGAGSFSVPFVPTTMASLGSSKFMEQVNWATLSPEYLVWQNYCLSSILTYMLSVLTKCTSIIIWHCNLRC